MKKMGNYVCDHCQKPLWTYYEAPELAKTIWLHFCDDDCQDKYIPIKPVELSLVPR